MYLADVFLSGDDSRTESLSGGQDGSRAKYLVTGGQPHLDHLGSILARRCCTPSPRWGRRDMERTEPTLPTSPFRLRSFFDNSLRIFRVRNEKTLRVASARCGFFDCRFCTHLPHLKSLEACCMFRRLLCNPTRRAALLSDGTDEAPPSVCMLRRSAGLVREELQGPTSRNIDHSRA